MIQQQYIKKQRHYVADKDPSSQSYGFSCSHVWVWELDHKVGWALQNWCLQTVVLKKTSESPLDSKEIKPVHSKGNQHWICIGRTDVEAEALILWPLMQGADSLEKTLWTGPNGCWEWLKAGGERDDRGWEGWLASQTQWTWAWTWDGEGQGSLVCCSPWSCKELDTTERLNNNQEEQTSILNFSGMTSNSIEKKNKN